MALARHKTLTIVANRREIYAAIRAAYREAGLEFTSLKKASLLQDPITDEERFSLLMWQVPAFVRKLPVLGPIIHWPPEPQGPWPLPAWRKRQREAAIEWFTRYPYDEAARRAAAEEYDRNEWGPA